MFRLKKLLKTGSMKISFLIGSLFFLTLSNCAQVVPYKKCEKSASTLNFEDIPTDLLYAIAEYLKSPFYTFVTLNRFFRDSTFLVKPVLRRYLDIPELLIGDDVETEKELKLLFPLVKFSNTEKHFIKGLEYEFFNNKFNVLVPNLLKYFDRVEPFYDEWDRVAALLDFKKYDIFFQNYVMKFQTHHNFYYKICDGKICEDLQLYIKGKPERLQYFKELFESNEFRHSRVYELAVLTWYQTAFKLDMPKSFYFEFPDHIIKIFTKTHQLFAEMVVPSHLYPEIHDIFLIAIKRFKDTDEIELYELMNSIRFGPDDLNLYAEQLKLIEKYTLRNGKNISLLFRCASLSNKMGLFTEMVKVYKSLFLEHPDFITGSVYGNSEDYIGIQKFVFDIHEAFNFNDRQLIYSDLGFLAILSYNYRICSVEFDKMKNTVEIQFRTHHNVFGIPERIIVNRDFENSGYSWLLEYFISNICLDFKFDNASAIEAFLKKLYDYYNETSHREFIEINGENLKLIASSESALETLRAIRELYSIKNHLFVVELEELLKVVDEPVPCLVDIIKLDSNAPNYKLADFNTPEKIERLETLLGHPVVSLLKHKIVNFFKYRYILKHFVKRGYEIPKISRQDTLKLLKIDINL